MNVKHLLLFAIGINIVECFVPRHYPLATTSRQKIILNEGINTEERVCNVQAVNFFLSND